MDKVGRTCVTYSKKDKRLIHYIQELFGCSISTAYRKALSNYWIPIVNAELKRRREKRERRNRTEERE